MTQDGWMDGNTDRDELRTILHRVGVRGPWLEKLCDQTALTPEIVRDEYKSILQDTQVRDPTAVLVRRLRDRLKVRVGRGPIDADVADLVGNLERKRRSMDREG